MPGIQPDGLIDQYRILPKIPLQFVQGVHACLVVVQKGMYQPVPGKELSGPAGHGRGVQDAEIHWRQSGMFPGILEIAEKIHESLENGTTVASIVKTGDGFYSGTSLEYRIPELHASLVIGESYGETAPVLPSAEMVVCFLAICLCNVRINSTPAHVFQKHPVGQGIDIVNSQSGAGAGIPGGSRNKEGVGRGGQVAFFNPPHGGVKIAPFQTHDQVCHTSRAVLTEILPFVRVQVHHEAGGLLISERGAVHEIAVVGPDRFMTVFSSISRKGIALASCDFIIFRFLSSCRTGFTAGRQDGMFFHILTNVKILCGPDGHQPAPEKT